LVFAEIPTYDGNLEGTMKLLAAFLLLILSVTTGLAQSKQPTFYFVEIWDSPMSAGSDAFWSEYNTQYNKALAEAGLSQKIFEENTLALNRSGGSSGIGAAPKGIAILQMNEVLAQKVSAFLKSQTYLQTQKILEKYHMQMRAFLFKSEVER
jgi:hypothetical protein